MLVSTTQPYEFPHTAMSNSVDFSVFSESNTEHKRPREIKLTHCLGIAWCLNRAQLRPSRCFLGSGEERDRSDDHSETSSVHAWISGS